MLINRKLQTALLATAIAPGFGAPAFAGPALPQPVRHGKVTYLSRGVGEAEEHAIEAAASHYNLRISNADKKGDFTTGTRLVIAAKGGGDLLRVARTGPLFYAKLPPGDYTIRATNDGSHRTRKVKIGAAGATDLHLIWPQMG
jgi:hypothetical protein